MYFVIWRMTSQNCIYFSLYVSKTIKCDGNHVLNLLGWDFLLFLLANQNEKQWLGRITNMKYPIKSEQVQKSKGKNVQQEWRDVIELLTSNKIVSKINSIKALSKKTQLSLIKQENAHKIRTLVIWRCIQETSNLGLLDER